jgi:hypothetical protein
MRFVDALDAIFRLAAAWKLFDHFVDTTWHIPVDRLEGNDISDVEFVERHRFLAFTVALVSGCRNNHDHGDDGCDHSASMSCCG